MGLGVGVGVGVREWAAREEVEVPSEGLSAAPTGLPSSPDDAHSPRPTPPPTTAVATATAISPRRCFNGFNGFNGFADERRLCWLTAPTYGPGRTASVHHTFRNSPVRVKLGHPTDTS